MSQVFGKWHVKRALHEGGQAHTFVVTEGKDTQKWYVLKRLKNPARLNRFRTEVEAGIRLQHPNIIGVVDSDLEVEKPYLVAEFCEGGTLVDLFKNPHSVDDVFRMFTLMAEATEFAHKAGVTHRDIKPQNIFVRAGDMPVIGDFGLCHFQDSDERATQTGEAVGARYFMAPEAEDGRVQDINPKMDIYSLGKLLYWMLSSGEIFSREKFRDERWNLRKMVKHPFRSDNVLMEHVNRLLDHMIVAEPDKRAGLGAIISSAHRIRSLLRREINPVAAGDQICTYCGWGRYQLAASKGGADIRNFGFQPVGDPDWRVFVCEECGHVQLFRVDLISADNPYNWWHRT